jgi:hypothetical protein
MSSPKSILVLDSSSLATCLRIEEPPETSKWAEDFFFARMGSLHCEHHEDLILSFKDARRLRLT